MLASILAALASPVGRIVGYVAAVGAIIGGYLFWLHEHDARILATKAASEAVIVAAQQVEDAHKALAAVQAEAEAADARAKAATSLKLEIANAPLTGDCVPFAPLDVALSGLRRAAGSNPGAAGNTGQPADVPPPAGHPAGHP